MVCLIIVYFHYHVSIFFCVRAHDDYCLTRAWIFYHECEKPA